MALPLPVNGVFRVHPDPGSNALADFCRGPSMVPAAHAPMTADAPARAGNRQSRGWSSRHARRVILERVMVSFAPAQECARIRPGIRLRHPASRPRTRTHGSMSGHNAPGTLQADTGRRTKDRTGQDRTGQAAFYLGASRDFRGPVHMAQVMWIVRLSGIPQRRTMVCRPFICSTAPPGRPCCWL